MSRTLLDISSLPNTLSVFSPNLNNRRQTDNIALLENERSKESLKVDETRGLDKDLGVKMNKCDKVQEDISSPTEKNLLTTKNDSTKDKKKFRRIAGVSDEVGRG